MKGDGACVDSFVVVVLSSPTLQTSCLVPEIVAESATTGVALVARNPIDTLRYQTTDLHARVRQITTTVPAFTILRDQGAISQTTHRAIAPDLARRRAGEVQVEDRRIVSGLKVNAIAAHHDRRTTLPRA